MDGDTLLDRASLLLEDFRELSSRYGAPTSPIGTSIGAATSAKQTALPTVAPPLPQVRVDVHACLGECMRLCAWCVRTHEITPHHHLCV